MLRQFSAGGLVFRPDPEGIRWLLRYPQANPNYKGRLGWNFPKGLLNPGETAPQAAIREVGEETGVAAEIISPLSTLKLFFTDSDGQKILKFVTFYLMRYLSDLPQGFDQETSDIRWVSLEEAHSLLQYPSERKLLNEAYSKLP